MPVASARQSCSGRSCKLVSLGRSKLPARKKKKKRQVWAICCRGDLRIASKDIMSGADRVFPYHSIDTWSEPQLESLHAFGLLVSTINQATTPRDHLPGDNAEGPPSMTPSCIPIGIYKWHELKIQPNKKEGIYDIHTQKRATDNRNRISAFSSFSISDPSFLSFSILSLLLFLWRGAAFKRRHTPTS